MKKEELEIIKEVIKEEGMRRDIGLLLGKKPRAVVRPSTFEFAGKWVLLLFGLAILIGFAYFYTRSEKAEVSPILNYEAAELGETKTDNNEEPSNAQLSDRGAENAIDKDLKQKGLSEKKVEKAQIPTNHNLPTSKRNKWPTAKGEAFNQSKPLPIRSKANLSKPGKQLSPQDEKVDESKSKSHTANGLAKRKEETINTDVPSQDSSKNPVKNSDSMAVETKEQESNTQKEDSTAVMNSIKDGSNGTDTKDSNKAIKKWDMMAGIGYGLLSTGDIPAFALNNALSYKITTRFSASFSASFGQSATGSQIENASYKQLELNVLYSPFKNNKKSDLRTGFGPTYYTSSRTYISSSQIVGGVVTNTYMVEKNNGLGVNLNVDYRYQISPKVLLGANVFSQRYFNGDIISGINLKAGFVF